MALDSIERSEKLEIENILVPHYGLLNAEETKKYFSVAKKNAIDTANEIAVLLRSGKSKDDAVEYFKNKYYKGKVKEVYPIDAMELNTNIMVDLIKLEFKI